MLCGTRRWSEGALLLSTQRTGEPIVLTRHGRPVAAAEEASDRAALAQARQDDDNVPWEQVKVDLGLV